MNAAKREFESLMSQAGISQNAAKKILEFETGMLFVAAPKWLYIILPMRPMWPHFLRRALGKIDESHVIRTIVMTDRASGHVRRATKKERM